MFAVSPSLDWKSQALPSSLLLLHLNSFFSSWSVWCGSWLTQGSTAASSEDIKASLLGIPHVTQPWITLTSFCSINYFILFSAYRKISSYWHLPAHNHVILMGTSCPLSKSPQLKQLNSSCTTQSSFLRPFNFKVNNEVGSKTDPRGALKMKQWKRNENLVNYSFNCREGSKSPDGFFSSSSFVVIFTVLIISYKL